MACNARHTLPAVFACSALLAQQPNLELRELLVDPVGPNAGLQLIEVVNLDSVPADLGGVHLVSAANDFALPTFALAPQGRVLLHLGANGTNGPGDLYLPQAAALDIYDAVSLFASPDTTDPNELIDFVSYGGGLAGIWTAAWAGAWPDPYTSVAISSTEGASIAHYGEFVFGSRDAPSAWFADSTPTLGLPNDAAAFQSVTSNCFGAPIASPPSFFANQAANRPWIGQDWEVRIFGLASTPSVAWFVLGAPQPLYSLNGLGITNCFSALSPLSITTHTLQPNLDTILIPVPNLAVLVGAELRAQGLLSGFAGLNPAGILATQTSLVRVGSR